MANNLNLLNTAVVRRVCNAIIDHLNNNCDIVPEGLYFDYQALPKGVGFSIQDLPQAVKLKVYMDQETYVGQYSFTIFYNAFADASSDRKNETAVLDNICDWLEHNKPEVDEHITINYIRQLYNTKPFAQLENGIITYQTEMTVNFNKF